MSYKDDAVFDHLQKLVAGIWKKERAAAIQTLNLICRHPH